MWGLSCIFIFIFNVIFDGSLLLTFCLFSLSDYEKIFINMDRSSSFFLKFLLFNGWFCVCVWF